MSFELRRPESEPDLLTRAARAWDRFFFTPADPTPLGVIRICGGLLILYVHLVYSFDLQTFFGKDAWLSLETINDIRHDGPTLGMPLGWPPEYAEVPVWTEEDRRYAAKWDLPDPRQVVARGNWKWSLWYHVTDPTWMAVLHGGILLAMLCLTVGLCTRIAAVVTWVGLLSYVNRSPNVLFGMDTIMIVVALYLMIGPCGAALSVDRLLARWRARKDGRPEDAPAWPPAPLVSANLALRLLQLHVCVIYFASGVSKLQGSTWWAGTAVWGTMANYEFSPMHYRLYMDYLRLLADNRWLWELVITGGTTFTLAFEIGFPFLVWVRPLRWIMLVSAVLLHTGIAFFMGLVGFSTIMLVLVLSFVPAAAFHRGLERLERFWSAGPPDPAVHPVPAGLSRSA